MNVGRWLPTFVAVEMPPDGSGQGIDGGGAVVDIAGTIRCLKQLCQEWLDIANRVKHVTAYDHIGAQFVRRILPARLQVGDIGEARLLRILLQEAQHGGIRLNGGHAQDERSEGEGKAPCPRAHVQDSGLRRYLATHTTEKRIALRGLLRGAMIAASAPIPEIGAGAT